MKPLLPVCKLCGDPILLDDVAYHKDGAPYLHARHFLNVSDTSLRPLSAYGTTSPAAPDADAQERDLDAGRQSGLAKLNQILRDYGLDPRGRMAQAARRALKVECPICRAPEGEPCFNSKGMAHRSRRRVAREAEEESRRERPRCGYGVVAAQAEGAP